MPGVFLSYRREDTGGYTGRLFDILSAQFGTEDIFMDLDTIKGGDEFANVIEEKVSGSDALVAVIGMHWLSISEADGTRRLDNDRDFVRREIATALKRGIRVIPVVMGKSSMPGAEDLPDDLKALCERQAVEIRDSHFRADAQELIDVLRKHLQPARHSDEIAGKWTATVTYDWGATYNEIFELEVDGDEVSGMAGFLGNREGQGRAIRDGKIAGKRISFLTKTHVAEGRFDQPYAEDKHYYKGSVEGDTIHFTMVTDSSVQEHSPIHFTAKKVKSSNAESI